MNYTPLIKQVEALITKYMQKHSNPKLLFHNIYFTQNIVSIADKISRHYTLEEKDFFVVMTAAWFLNAGYYKDSNNVAESSTRMAEEFLVKMSVEPAVIEEVKSCLLVCTSNNAPGTLAQKIVCDAGTFYLGAENFAGYNKLRFREALLLGDDGLSKNEWRRNTILLFENHQFYTDYCITRLNGIKQENFENLLKKNPMLSLTPGSIESMFEEPIPGDKPDSWKKDQAKNNDKDKEKAKEGKLGSAERTVETMFKTTTASSQELSTQADTKANIMISANTLVLPVLFYSLEKIDRDEIVYPLLLMSLVSLATIVFSVLATRPNIKSKMVSDEDLKQKKINLLFFGNFLSMDFETYRHSMLALMSDREDLYTTMLKNLYEQGIVLARKYKMLKISYTIFMYGLILSVLAFVIAFTLLGD